jgi:serine/threonine protein kinase
MPLYTNEGTDDQTLVFPDSEWKDISQNAKDFARNLLQYNPQRRMCSADAFKHPWLHGALSHSKQLSNSESSVTLHSATFLKNGLNRSQQLERIQSAVSPKSKPN